MHRAAVDPPFGTGSGTMDAPEISVVMPVYNVASFLAESIESILRQTTADFEFVIVDDGSTDGSGVRVGSRRVFSKADTIVDSLDRIDRFLTKWVVQR